MGTDSYLLVLGVTLAEYYRQKQDDEKYSEAGGDRLTLEDHKYHIDGYVNQKNFEITYNEISEVATSLKEDDDGFYARPLGFLCYYSGARFKMKSGNIFYRLIKSQFPKNIVYHASEYLYDSETLPELLLELIRWPVLQKLLIEQWEIFPPPLILIILSFLIPDFKTVPGIFKVKQ
jgi:hypothetical protein